jgi:tape measure domain-containing protein
MADFNLDASKAIAEIRNLINEVNNIKTALKNISTSGVDNFDKLESKFSNLNNKIGLLTNKMNYLEAIIRKNNSAINSNTQATNANANANDKNAKNIDKSTRALNNNNKTVKNSSKGLSGLNNGLNNIITSFGIIFSIRAFINIIAGVFETIKTFDSLNFALEKITGSLFDAADSQRFLIDLTQRFGVELVSTTNRWIKFLAAAKQSGLSLKDTEDIFRSMTKAAGVLGLKTDELQGIYLALEQMLSKGKVTTEELRRQLGERLPGAMGIMAAAIGVTLPKLDEMLKKGEVLSADVLPKFAKAVELAYDIENVNRIETLVAAQNRLTTAWQLFIKNISEGDSVIKKFFSFFLEQIEKTITGWDRILSTDDQKLQKRISDYTNVLTSELNKSFSTTLGLQKGFFNQEELLRKNANKAKLAIENSTNKESKLIAEEQYAKALTDIKLFNEEKEKLIKEYAVENLEAVKFEYDEDLKLREQLNNKILRLEELKNQDPMKFAKNQKPYFEYVFGDTKFFGDAIKNQEDFNEVFEKATSNVVISTSKWALYKKLVEKSIDTPIEDYDSDTAKKQRQLRDIADLSLELQNEILKNNADLNKRIIDDNKSSFDQRRQALYDYHKNQVTIAENSNAIVLRDLEASRKKELESLENSVKEGSLSKEKYDKFVLDSEAEKNQKIKIAYQKLQNELSSINESTLKINEEINKSLEEVNVSDVENIYNKRIIAAKKEFDASKKTIEDKKKLEKELKEVSIEAANAIIDKKIEILKATIAGKNADEEWVREVQKAIDKLESTREIIPGPDEKDLDKWKKFWDEVLGLASDFNNALGDIIDNVFARRIENINAEIDAEEKKYDSLIDLAEGDEAQQDVLRRNKEIKIAELEKKRLKQEQKAAKARKTFAISDILISTAQAIMSIWAQVPKFDFGISAGLMTAFVSALGAAQIASVLTAPIPKYKEGGKIKHEHTGMINDGLHQEYLERNSEILTTDRKNAILRLQPGDTIYKNYDEMISKSNRIKAMTNYNKINKDKFDDLFFGVENSIDKGFKKAKINNNIINRVIVKDNYDLEMSRWN